MFYFTVFRVGILEGSSSSSLQLPSDHYKPLSYDEEFRHWVFLQILIEHLVKSLSSETFGYSSL
jgi:hypothetical protein